MVEKLLAELFLNIVGDYKAIIVKNRCPKRRKLLAAVDGVICGSKEGGAIEAIECGDEASALEESKNAFKVFVTTKHIGERCRL